MLVMKNIIIDPNNILLLILIIYWIIHLGVSEQKKKLFSWVVTWSILKHNMEQGLYIYIYIGKNWPLPFLKKQSSILPKFPN